MARWVCQVIVFLLGRALYVKEILAAIIVSYSATMVYKNWAVSLVESPLYRIKLLLVLRDRQALWFHSELGTKTSATPQIQWWPIVANRLWRMQLTWAERLNSVQEVSFNRYLIDRSIQTAASTRSVESRKKRAHRFTQRLRAGESCGFRFRAVRVWCGS